MSAPSAPEPTGRNAPDTPTGGPTPRRGRRRRPKRRGGNTASATTRKATPAKTPARGAPPPGGAAGALSESLQAAVFAHTSAAVLARGRGYAKRNRVSQLRVSAGTVRARVLGSAEERYHVELTTPTRPAPIVVAKIRWACNCPYAVEHRRGTCKHVVAVALVAAKRFERTESMRRRWLGEPAAEAAEAAPAEFDVLAERLLAAFTAQPVNVDEVLARAIAIAPPPFDVPRLRR